MLVVVAGLAGQTTSQAQVDARTTSYPSPMATTVNARPGGADANRRAILTPVPKQRSRVVARTTPADPQPEGWNLSWRSSRNVESARTQEPAHNRQAVTRPKPAQPMNPNREVDRAAVPPTIDNQLRSRSTPLMRTTGNVTHAGWNEPPAIGEQVQDADRDKTDDNERHESGFDFFADPFGDRPMESDDAPATTETSLSTEEDSSSDETAESSDSYERSNVTNELPAPQSQVLRGATDDRTTGASDRRIGSGLAQHPTDVDGEEAEIVMDLEPTRSSHAAVEPFDLGRQQVELTPVSPELAAEGLSFAPPQLSLEQPGSNGESAQNREATQTTERPVAEASPRSAPARKSGTTLGALIRQNRPDVPLRETTASNNQALAQQPVPAVQDTAADRAESPSDLPAPLMRNPASPPTSERPSQATQPGNDAGRDSDTNFGSPYLDRELDIEPSFSCDEFRAKIAAQDIRQVSLDISPPYLPGILEQGKYDQLKAEFDDSQPIRQWRNMSGRPLATGSFRDYAYEKIVIETENGSTEELPVELLSEADLAYVSESWGVPIECRLEQSTYTPRTWVPVTMTWTANNLCHKPLYFEEVNLERYGHTAGPVLQPVISSAHFFVNIAVLPYKMGVHTPGECQYALGYYRPGDCAPWIVPPVPLSLRGGLSQAAAMTGLFWLVP